MRLFADGDPVVLPSGRRAVVVRRLSDGRVECRYLKSDPWDMVALPPEQLRLIKAGIVPPPARVSWPARA